MEISEIAMNWQAGIAAIIGFTGVCTTLWQNARPARRQAIWLREQTRKSVASAYKAELLIIRDGASTNINNIENYLSNGRKNAGMHTMGTTYAQCFDRIPFTDTTLLSNLALTKVIVAYSILKRTLQNHKLYGEKISEDSDSVLIHQENASTFLAMEVALLTVVEEALSALTIEQAR